MIWIKGFFSKTTTKVYLFVLCFLFIGIYLLNSFTNYYTNLLNTVFRENTVLYVIGQNNYYNTISQYKSIESIEEALVFSPNYECKTLARQGQIIQDMTTGSVISNIPSEELSRLTWEELAVIRKGNRIFVLPSDDLKENEIRLSLSIQVSYDIPLSELYNEPLDIKYNGTEYNFVIKEIVNSRFPEIHISRKKFNEIKEHSNVYAYKVLMNSYYDAQNIVQKLNEKEQNSDFYVSLNRVEDQNDKYDMSSLIEMTDILRMVSLVATIVLILVFCVIIKNIISEEKGRMRLQYSLGYNKTQSKKVVFIELLILLSFVLLIALFMSMLLIMWIKNSQNISLELFDFAFLTQIILIVIIIISSFLLILKTYL